MKISKKDLPSNITLVTFDGHIDESSIALVQDIFVSLFNSGRFLIICDMTEVEHISAPVFKTFIENLSEAKRRGGCIKLCNVASSLRGVFRYAGFSDESAFVDSIESGIKILRDFNDGKNDNKNDDPFGSTLQTSNVYAPTIQGGKSPLINKTPYEPTVKGKQSPLSRTSSPDEPYKATIQMSGSPLKSKSSSNEPYGTTIQMSGSPLKKKPFSSPDEPFEATIQMSGSPLQDKLSSDSTNAPYAPTTVENKSPLQEAAQPTAIKETAPENIDSKKKGKKNIVDKNIQEAVISSEEQIETEIKRKSTIRFYKQMYPFCTFPLKVIFSQEKIQKIVHKKITQIEGKQDIVVTREKPIIEVVPHMPGCLVVPPNKKVDITPDISQANFSITPLAESKNQKGYIEIHYNGEVLDTIEEITYSVEKQTIAKMALYMSIISPVVSTSLDALQIDFNDNLPLIVQWLSKATEIFGGKTGFGFALAGLFFVVAIIFYLVKRPKEANPIENILPVQE